MSCTICGRKIARNQGVTTPCERCGRLTHPGCAIPENFSADGKYFCCQPGTSKKRAPGQTSTLAPDPTSTVSVNPAPTSTATPAQTSSKRVRATPSPGDRPAPKLHRTAVVADSEGNRAGGHYAAPPHAAFPNVPAVSQLQHAPQSLPRTFGDITGSRGPHHQVPTPPQNVPEPLRPVMNWLSEFAGATMASFHRLEANLQSLQGRIADQQARTAQVTAEVRAISSSRGERDDCEVRVAGVPLTCRLPLIVIVQYIFNALGLNSLNVHIVRTRFRGGGADPRSTLLPGVTPSDNDSFEFIVQLSGPVTRDTVLYAAPRLRDITADSILGVGGRSRLYLSRVMPSQLYNTWRRARDSLRGVGLLQPYINNMTIYVRLSPQLEPTPLHNELDIERFVSTSSRPSQPISRPSHVRPDLTGAGNPPSNQAASGLTQRARGGRRKRGGQTVNHGRGFCGADGLASVLQVPSSVLDSQGASHPVMASVQANASPHVVSDTSPAGAHAFSSGVVGIAGVSSSHPSLLGTSSIIPPAASTAPLDPIHSSAPPAPLTAVGQERRLMSHAANDSLDNDQEPMNVSQPCIDMLNSTILDLGTPPTGGGAGAGGGDPGMTGSQRV